MATPLITFNDLLARSLMLDVGPGSLWFADVRIAQPVDMPEQHNAGVLTIAGRELRGTIDAPNSGVFVLDSRVRVVGGAFWRKDVKALGYHNDAGIKAATVALALAGAVGESLQIAPSSNYQLAGVDYARRAGPAARELSALFPSWYVALDGTTYVARRAPVSVPVDVLAYDVGSGVATCMFDALTVDVGDQITSPKLPSAMRVRGYSIEITPAKARAHYWIEAP